jgi:ABC-2 type transport system ATP-binding protein
VLVSSHLLAELAMSADAVVIIKNGHLVTEGMMSELAGPVEAGVRVRTPQADELHRVLTSRGIRAELGSTDQVVARGVTTQQVGEAVAAAGLVVYEMSVERPQLEDVFLQLTADDRSAS